MYKRQVGDLTEALAALSDELQELKEKMDSKGDSVRYCLPATHQYCRIAVRIICILSYTTLKPCVPLVLQFVLLGSF